MALLDSSSTGEAAPEGSEYPERRWILLPESRPEDVLSILRESSRTTTASPAVSAADEWMRASDPDTFVVQPATVVHDSPPQARFRSLQSWEGRVVEVLKDSFVGVLADMTMPGVEEQAELDLQEVTPDDLPLVQPGAVFYWSIGYRQEPSGTRSRASEIRFRRLPRWSKPEVEDIAYRVEALKARMGIGRRQGAGRTYAEADLARLATSLRAGEDNVSADLVDRLLAGGRIDDVVRIARDPASNGPTKRRQLAALLVQRGMAADAARFDELIANNAERQALGVACLDRIAQVPDDAATALLMKIYTAIRPPEGRNLRNRASALGISVAWPDVDGKS